MESGAGDRDDLAIVSGNENDGPVSDPDLDHGPCLARDRVPCRGRGPGRGCGHDRAGGDHGHGGGRAIAISNEIVSGDLIGENDGGCSGKGNGSETESGGGAHVSESASANRLFGDLGTASANECDECAVVSENASDGPTDAVGTDLEILCWTLHQQPELGRLPPSRLLRQRRRRSAEGAA